MLLPIPITDDIHKMWAQYSHYFTGINFLLLLKVILYIILGIVITLYVCRVVGKLSAKHISAHHSQLLRRLTFYIGLIFSIVLPLNLTGIDVTGLLSAAGIAAGIITAIVAFAAQTSISNFLSGIFLIAEKPFVIGDMINMQEITGEVLSIDLLSVKIRTKDNTFIRIPNETLLKSQFKNLSRFPIRRFDIKLRVSFKENLEKVKHVLMNVAANNPLALVSPAPEVTFMEFGDSGAELQFSVWSKQSSYSTLQSSIQMEIQSALNANHIDIPLNKV